MATDFRLIGKDFIPPDVRAKVTGAAKYAEDFRAEGMLFAKLLLSPYPRARVRHIDASEALAMDGVVAILTADDIPPNNTPFHERLVDGPALTNEPLFRGQPVLAVAAETETIAAEAVERIKVDFEPLPFVLNPLDSLRPGGVDATPEGNVGGSGVPLQTIKWTARDFAQARPGQLPMGKPAEEWSYGDVDAAFEEADLVLDETFVSHARSHQCMEPRSAMAYWQNGKLYMYGSHQDHTHLYPAFKESMGLEPDEFVLINPFCGSGWGSKAGGSGAWWWTIPAFLAKKTGRPVMHRMSREEEYYLGQAKAAMFTRVRIALRNDGRILGVDLYVVQANGPYAGFWQQRGTAGTIAKAYQPVAMRYRGVPVLTNTIPTTAYRAATSGHVHIGIMEPLMDRAARELGVDPVAMRRINVPGHDDEFFDGVWKNLSSSYAREAWDKGAAAFRWDEKKHLNGQRRGKKLIGVGVGYGTNLAGRTGFDGLVVIRPDGRLYIHNGMGNLGTYSYAGTARVAAEVLKMPWEQCEVFWGDTRQHMPWNVTQSATASLYTMSRTNYVAAMDAKAKLQEIAAMSLGGEPSEYDVGNGRVYLKSDPSTFISFAEAAQKAVELGGKYSGHELPDDIHEITRIAARGVAGQGLVGVAKDNLPTKDSVETFMVGFAKVEVDVETGEVTVLEYAASADCGTVLHPQSLEGQVRGGIVEAIGFALLDKHVYDPQEGMPLAARTHTLKIPTFSDVPLGGTTWDPVNLPDPTNPVGAKGIGEPALIAAAAAVNSAVSNALGGIQFNRTPVTRDMILNALAGQNQSYEPLDLYVY